MSNIFENFKIPEKSRITNERQEIISQFVDEINKERIGTKFKPVTGRGIAIKLSILKTNNELYQFLSICKKYKLENKSHSFSKCFFGACKVR